MIKKILTLFICLPLISQAQFKTKEISIFKNGTGFFIKSGKLKAKSGVVDWSKNLPNPVFGTIWFNSPKNALKGISSFEGDVLETKDAEDLLGILKANVGKKADITTSKGQVSGIINDVSSGYLTLKISNKYRILFPRNILNVEFTDKPAVVYQDEVKKQVLRLTFNNQDAEQALDLMYMQSGIGWTPNYLVQLKGKDKAVITLRANVVNDAEDFENANLHFVVGIPNFKYQHMFSPLTSGHSLTDFLNLANGDYRLQRGDNFAFNNIMAQNVAYTDAPTEMSGSGGSFEGLSGESAEDLYFYHLKDVSLKKGGRAFYDVLKTELSVEHVYEVQLKQNGSSSYYSQGFSFNELYHNEVWHSIKLKNNTDYPLTTGSAMVTKLDGNDEKPISQDELRYTPVKGTSYMRITESSDIMVKDIEQEAEINGPTKKFSGYDYKQITVKGTVTLKNYKSEKVKMRIKRKIIGELVKSDIEWQKNRAVRSGSSLNEENDICWEFNVSAGEETKINYSYKVWIRR